MKRLAVAGLSVALVAATVVLANDTTHVTKAACNGQPDYKCTPGVVDTSITKADLCPHLGPRVVRSVSAATKTTVRNEYGVKNFHGEIDHLISLELGGSNDIKNLWPQPGSIPNAKDVVENQLHKQVCAGQITLSQAQIQIVHWKG